MLRHQDPQQSHVIPGEYLLQHERDMATIAGGVQLLHCVLLWYASPLLCRYSLLTYNYMLDPMLAARLMQVYQGELPEGLETSSSMPPETLGTNEINLFVPLRGR